MGRIRLREFADDDVDAVLSVYGDPAVTKHLSFEPHVREDVVRLIGVMADRARENPRVEYALAVELHEHCVLIGSARLALGEHRSGQIGFALRADCWGQGFGTETVQALLTLAFHSLGLHRVWAARAPDNAASDRLLRRVGMVPEGRIRDHVFVRGAWRDSLTYSILENEFRLPIRTSG